MWVRRTGWIKPEENALNAHKGSSAWLQRTPPLADKAVPCLLSTGGQYHSLTATAPLSFFFSFHWDQKHPSLSVLKLWHKSQWHPFRQTMDNKEKRAHSWKFYSENSLELLSRRELGSRSGCWVGVVVTISLDWDVDLWRNMQMGGGIFFPKQKWILITTEVQAAPNVSNMSSVDVVISKQNKV